MECRACRATLIACRVGGIRLLLDPEPREPRVGLIAYNPRSGGGRELRIEDVRDVEPVSWRWAYAGVTFHPLHAEVCRMQPVPARLALGQQGLRL